MFNKDNYSLSMANISTLLFKIIHNSIYILSVNSLVRLFSYRMLTTLERVHTIDHIHKFDLISIFIIDYMFMESAITTPENVVKT